MDLTVGMWMFQVKFKKELVFHGSQSPGKVTRSEIVKSHSHNISRCVKVKNLIQMSYIEYKVPIAFGGDKRSFEVIGNPIVISRRGVIFYCRQRSLKVPEDKKEPQT